MRGLKQVRHSLMSWSVLRTRPISVLSFHCVNAVNPASYRYVVERSGNTVAALSQKERRTALRELSLQSSITGKDL